MIIPAVFTFMGREGMSAGPALMFISLPKVFDAMGGFGVVAGIFFFVMVTFAALTSNISIMEAIAASFMDRFGWSRAKATTIIGLYAILGGLIVCLGYNKLYFELPLPNGAIAQVLDLADYISNNIAMPVVAIGECILIGWVAGPDWVIGEFKRAGSPSAAKRCTDCLSSSSRLSCCLSCSCKPSASSTETARNFLRTSFGKSGVFVCQRGRRRVQ